MTENKGCKILIVDDSATTRALIRRILRMAGAPQENLLEAGNGKAALELMGTTPVDLVIADLHMPEMDGLEMTRRILSDPASSSIPVIVVSAEPSAQKIAALRQTGIRGYLRKPFTPEQIKGAITDILGPDRFGQAAQLAGRQREPESTIMVDTQTVRFETAALFEAMPEALAQALETMAFVSLMPAEPGAAPALPALHATIQFQLPGGPRRTLAVVAPAALGTMLASNILAEESPTPEQAQDVLKELLNVTCGLLLGRADGSAVEGVFMGIPQVGDFVQPAEWEAFEAQATVLDADGLIIAAKIETEN